MRLFKKIKEHIGSQYLSAHMPGHKSGDFLPEEIEKAFGKKVFEYDITEVEEMDNLQDPKGVIKETEDTIAKYAKAKQAFILVNGSTGGLLASIFALARNKEIFVGANCHQGVYNGMIIAGSHPIFITPDIDAASGTELGVSPESLEKAIKKYPNCKVLMLTLPNYYGIRYKYKEVINIAKRNHLTIIIDEAHGAHFTFMDSDSPNGIVSGGDVVIQSWHKTLPVLNQGSVLLIGEGMESDDFREYINLFQTTSPSYLIMSSIDVAGKFLNDQKKEVQTSALKWEGYFSNLLFKNINIVKFPEDQKDPFKLLVYSKKETRELFREIIVEKYKIQPEINDEKRLLFMFPLFFDERLARTLKKALLDLDRNLEGMPLLQNDAEPIRENILKLKKSPQEMSHQKTKKIVLSDSIGKTCAQKVVKYPPGVPLIFPGEVLEKEIVCYLNRHKINYNLQEGIKIFIDQEK